MFNNIQRTPPKGRGQDDELAPEGRGGEAVRKVRSRQSGSLDPSDVLSTPQMPYDPKRPRLDSSTRNMVNTPMTQPRSGHNSEEALGGSLSIQEDSWERTDTPMVNCYQATNMIRSDVLQLLETKTQAINKFEKEACTMQERLEQAEVSRDQAVLRVQQLETLGARASMAEESRHSEVVEETNKLEKANKQHIEAVAELTRNVRKLEDALEAAQASAAVAKRELGVRDSELSAVRLEMRRTVMDLTLELKEERANAEHHADRSRQLEARFQMADAGLAAAAEERDTAADERRSAERSLAAALSRANALQEQLDLAKDFSKEGGMAPSERETELAETVKSLREELAAYEGEVKAARRLQYEVANAHLLTEQLTSSERRAERAEAAAGVTQ